ncbi:50S ribosomal protein L28 [Buchnera aphidicola str. Bp (Baizongia pistaciae)]|uniref:Large ribosomal subunit protein bL28 n=1 Tax=Buchnera aphidicola subsp. Baizongia pistaciae (strain Bp) TaxID=224915 RepID=RL28_BUCBP|nr:50S ribosomal protein L28 [Buchnera aphidicola]Q89AY8.1 RecName: Full=Large ribosomal subunit protein bL28; AltName: Full=50S ribosomal protein L28 [Buchnera aphidicola str. Bp (Baizongia pistaciae)]AAO26816.1 50S ribosomal protein L28 [Buchnera aphidicola str. Bp (Baizongia pistaciae)]
MSKICQITGKKPITGNNRSHAMNATKRRFFPNLHFHKFWNPKTKRFIILRVSAKGMRNIDKLGLNSLKIKKLHK